MVATQRPPPAICCENAPRGSKAMEKSTTTRPEKKIMEIMASRVRHSMRRSLARWGKGARVMIGPLGSDRWVWKLGFPPLASRGQGETPRVGQRHFGLMMGHQNFGLKMVLCLS